MALVVVPGLRARAAGRRRGRGRCSPRRVRPRRRRSSTRRCSSRSRRVPVRGALLPPHRRWRSSARRGARSRSRRACLVAPLVRDQLVLLPLGARAGRRRSSGSRGERAPGCAAGLAPAALGRSGRRARRRCAVVLGRCCSPDTLGTSGDVASDDPARIVEHGLWALGSLDVGLGVLPFVAALAVARARPAGCPRPAAHVRPACDPLRAVLGFGVYTARKASTSAATFEPRIVERNLIYLDTARSWSRTALLLRIGDGPHRRRSLGAAAALRAYAIVTRRRSRFDASRSTRTHRARRSSHRRPGLRLGGRRDRHAARGAARAVGSSCARCRAACLRPGAGLAVVAAVAAVCALALGSAGAERRLRTRRNDFSRVLQRANLPEATRLGRPDDGGAPTVYIGQEIADPNGDLVSSSSGTAPSGRSGALDGNAPGPGPTLTPDLARPDGDCSGRPRATGYAVARLRCRARRRRSSTGRGGAASTGWPTRCGSTQTTRGVFTDGWMAAATRRATSRASYTASTTARRPRQGARDASRARAGAARATSPRASWSRSGRSRSGRERTACVER